MCDEDNGLALRGQGAHDAEQVVAFLRGQDGCRLIEDEHIGAAVESLDDLHTLLDAHRQVFDVGIRVNVQAVLVRELANALRRAFQIEHAVAHDFHPQDDVLGHGHHRDEHEVLVHHADPLGDGIVRTADVDFFAVQEDLAFIGPVETVEDVHQGGLAGAVLAEKTVNLALMQLKADVIVGQDAGEALGDALHFESQRHASPPGRSSRAL